MLECTNEQTYTHTHRERERERETSKTLSALPPFHDGGHENVNRQWTMKQASQTFQLK